MAAAILNEIGDGRFQAFSGGVAKLPIKTTALAFTVTSITLNWR